MDLSLIVKLVLLIICYSAWSTLVQWIKVMLVGWQSDKTNTKESALCVCYIPYKTNKEKYMKGEEFELERNGELPYCHQYVSQPVPLSG